MQCSPFHTATLLHPVFRQLEYAAGFLPEDTADAKLDKLEALLRHGVEDVAEGMALLAPLLSLPASERYGAIELAAEQRKERVLRFLGDQLLGLALRNPVLLVLEDAHWIDPATREFIDHLLPRIADAPILMLITHRPEFQSEWTRHPHVTALTLSRLSRGQGIEVVRAAGGAALSEDLVARIGQRAGGVPLFIEELTKSVLDSGDALGDSEIPETLQASLLARLDRLGPDAKELAQIAAVIGREFGAALLRAVTGKPAEALAVELGRLVASEIVLSAGSAPDGYMFRHALIQDAAYQSLLLSRRRQYHGAIAEALETGFPEVAESQPELIAQHYTAAEMPERAIPFWLRAGERSRARFGRPRSDRAFRARPRDGARPARRRRPVAPGLGAAPGSRRRAAADQWPAGRGFGDMQGGGGACPCRGRAGRPRAGCLGRPGSRDLDRSADARGGRIARSGPRWVGRGRQPRIARACSAGWPWRFTLWAIPTA